MKISSTKLMITLNIMGSIMILSSSSWTSIWLGMEITSMSLPPLMVATDSSIVSKINSWKYYMIQCYASSVFLMCILCLSFSTQNWMYSNLLWIVMMTCMLLKMGITPFHGWLFQLSSSISWPMFLIISSIQKIGPLIIISESSKAISSSLIPDLFTSTIVSISSIHGILINSTRFIMITSSMINSAWMIASIQISKMSFISFMMFYFIHLLIIFFFFNNSSSNLTNATLFFKKENFMNELMKSMVFLSLIGMPPTLGFFIKFSIINQLIQSTQFFSTLVLSLSSSIIMIMYLNMAIFNLNSMRIETMQNKPNLSISLSLTLMLTCPILFFS